MFIAMRSVNLDQLRAFVKVVERGKFHGGGSLIGRSMRLEILRSGASRQTRSRRGLGAGQASLMWTLAFGHQKDRTQTHGYAATREAAMAAVAKSWRRK